MARCAWFIVLLSPSCRSEVQELEECETDEEHQRVTLAGTRSWLPRRTRKAQIYQLVFVFDCHRPVNKYDDLVDDICLWVDDISLPSCRQKEGFNNDDICADSKMKAEILKSIFLWIWIGLFRLLKGGKQRTTKQTNTKTSNSTSAVGRIVVIILKLLEPAQSFTLGASQVEPDKGSD